MKDDLKSKGYRDAFVKEGITTGLAFQIRALREHKGWTQADLGKKMGKPQNVVSRLEDPEYGNYTMKTLLALASAFDVALTVKFVSFGTLLDALKNVSAESLAVLSFDEEEQSKQRQPRTETSVIQQAAHSSPSARRHLLGRMSMMRDLETVFGIVPSTPPSSRPSETIVVTKETSAAESFEPVGQVRQSRTASIGTLSSAKDAMQ